jgi:hypothetical protein
MTCGRAECARQWHKKKCAQWNQKNTDYFKTNYLQKKIDTATQCRGDPGKIQPEKHFIKVPASRMKTDMPLAYVKEVIGVQMVIIHEYLAQLLDRRWQKEILAQRPFNAGPTCRLHQKSFSRGDTTSTDCNH